MTVKEKEKLTISIEEMLNKFEPLIRRVVREELTKVVNKEQDVFNLKPETPLYDDMEEIIQRKAKGKIELYSEQEVWNG